MNSQFPSNPGQMPPVGYGGQPPGPLGPGQNMYNGQGPSGQFGGPMPPKQGMVPNQFGMQPMQNGPPSGNFQGGGPQGDSQYGAPRASMPPGPGKPPQMGGQFPARPPTSFPGPGSGQPPTTFAGPGGGQPPSGYQGPGGGQLLNQFQGPGGGHPPTSFQSSGGGPPSSFQSPGMGPPRPGVPPTVSNSQVNQLSNHMNAMNVSTAPRGPSPGAGMGMPGPPMGGGPQHPGMTAPQKQPSGFPPSSNISGPPTSQVGMSSAVPPSMGMPQNRYGPPPSNMGAPSTSMGAPPTSMGAPPSSMGAPPRMGAPPSMGAPPTSMGAPPNMGAPPTSMGVPPRMGTPPTSMGAPPTSMSHNNFGAPPSSMGQPGGMAPMGPSSGPGMMAPPVSGQSGYSMGNMPPTQPGLMGPSQPGQMGSGQFQPPSGGQYMGGTMPGQGFPTQSYPGQPKMGGPQGMQQPAPKKLDPDQMPSPIQVIEDDRANRSGIFQTNGRGLVPPLVTTKFTVQDQGNCNPRFMRSTMYNVPCTADMLKNSYIPFALSICPFARVAEQENEPPIVNLGEIGPVRCKRCKAYMSPFMQFIDGGRRFQCVFCGAATDVPAEYFQHLDHTGRRVDCFDRAELCLGSYEFVATKDYCKQGVLPKAPAFIFMIDVSYNSIKSGLVNLICERLKDDILVNLPKETGAEESEIRVGFVTYAKEIHFYNVKGNLAQPQMLVVSDLDDVFVPLLDGFLVTLAESEAVIDSLLSQIPQMFADSRETETILGPVIQAGLDALKASDRSGKLYIFHTSLPIAEAPGKLKNRDDRKLLGTEKEKTILTPQNNFYTNLGKECVTAGCSVDLFLFPNSYVDVATISEVCRLTGGNMYKYSYFQADLDGERFIEDLKKNVENQKAFDAILRVRTSTGIRAVDFYGNFYMANTTDVEVAAMDRDQAINVEIKHDDKLNESEGAYIQIAALYTSVSGQRRLRIHNLSLNCCTQMADLFRNCELDALVNYMAKQAIRTALNTNPKQVREAVMNQVSQILACYRKNCASPSSAGQLILPECMKLLPVYSNCIIKSDGLQGGQEISTDDRSYLMHLINSMDVITSHVFFYPRLIPVIDLEDDASVVPKAIRCSSERLQDHEVYLLENGISMFMWIGHNVDPHWIQQVFGVQSAAQVDIDKCTLLDLDNTLSQRLREVISEIRRGRHRYMKLIVVRQRDKLEPWFNHFLVEDKGMNGSASYVDFLCHIHKEIRNLLS